MWKYDTPKSAKILGMPPGQAEEAEPLWGQRFLTAWLTSSPFLIFKYAAERGPALTQTTPHPQFCLRDEEGRKGRTRITERLLRRWGTFSPPFPQWEVEWYQAVALSWGSQRESMCCPYSWPLTSRSLPFPLAKVPRILDISGKCSQPEGTNMINLKSIRDLRAQAGP